MNMQLGLREEIVPLLERVRTMIREEVMPLEDEYHAEIGKGDRWAFTDRQAEILEGLKAGPRPTVVELLAHRQRPGVRAEHGGIRLFRRRNGQDAVGGGGVQLFGARHRQYGGAGTLRL